MKKLFLPLSLSLILSSCIRQPMVLVDHHIPHRIVHPVKIEVWVEVEQGKFLPQEVTVPADWWIAPPSFGN